MADSQFLHKNETHQIIGSAMEVLNEIGHGFHEKIYENALVVEFGLRRIPVNQQPDFPVIYKSVNVGSYVPDLIWSSSAFICVHLRFALNEFAYFRTS